jgi:hypothetical protein
MAMHREEYVPLMSPIINGNVNSFKDAMLLITANTYTTMTQITVVKEVLMDRAKLWFRLLLARSFKSPLYLAPLFSLILSYTTMVSLIEYPMIVKVAATKDSLTGTSEQGIHA